MASYEFQSSLYPTQNAMLDGIAEAFLSDGGQVYPNDTSAGLAAECIEQWGLDQEGELDVLDDARAPSHMAKYNYEADDLAAAFRRIRPELSA